MKAETQLTRNAAGTILECRLTGLFAESDMLEACAEMRRAADRCEGQRHIVVADMRGMKTVHPSVARHMGEAIGYWRERGCVLCVHVSDDTVQRLQARRLAREYSPTDDLTVEASSIEEARAVAKSYEKYLADPRYHSSIREAITQPA